MENTENISLAGMDPNEKRRAEIKDRMHIKANCRRIAIVGLVLLAMTLYGLFSIVSHNKKVEENVRLFADSQVHLNTLQNASDYMTEQVRLFVMTQDSHYMERYFAMVDSEYRELALQELKQVLDNEEFEAVLGSVSRAFLESDALMEYELHCMKLVSVYAALPEEEIPEAVRGYKLSEAELRMSPEAQLEAGYVLVFGGEYRDAKTGIDAEIQHSLAVLSDKLKQDAVDSTTLLHSSVNQLTLYMLVLFCLMLIVFISIAVMIVGPLESFVHSIEEDKEFEVYGAYEFQYMALTYNEMFEANKENRARLKFKAEHDILTNLFNRQAFEDEKKTLREVHFPVAMLMVDVDHFKEINDRYGHGLGDEALVRVADALTGSFRDEDFIARLGGDEFVVFLMRVTEQDSDLIAQKVQQMNELLQNPLEGEIPISLSVGAAFSAAGYRDELYGKADEALYSVKANGRCGYAAYRE